MHYAPSTKFYLPTSSPANPGSRGCRFPVHVVERVETYDRISRNRFVTRYAYHHGYFDGVEREFRGFGMVEQWDTEEIAALSASGAFPYGHQYRRSLRTCRRCSPRPGSIPASTSAAITFRTSLPAARRR